MSAQANFIFGMNISRDYDSLWSLFEQTAPNSMLADDDLAEFIMVNNLGSSLYDGGGWGQATYIGVEVPKTPDGIIVTQEVRDKVKKIYDDIPERLRNVLLEHYGTLPEPRFHVLCTTG